VGPSPSTRLHGDARSGVVSGSTTDASAERKAGLRDGDDTYFKNWDVSSEGQAAGWQGENVFSLGGDDSYGHRSASAPAHTSSSI